MLVHYGAVLGGTAKNGATNASAVCAIVRCYWLSKVSEQRTVPSTPALLARSCDAEWSNEELADLERCSVLAKDSVLLVFILMRVLVVPTGACRFTFLYVLLTGTCYGRGVLDVVV